MESLKQKLLRRLSALVSSLLAKLGQLNKFLATHFFVCLIIVCTPCVVLLLTLIYQQHRVEEVTKGPLLSKKKVRSLEKQLTTYKAQAQLYQHKSDSLQPLLLKQRATVKRSTIFADSLHARLSKPPLFTSPSELRTYLLHYTPSPDSL